MLQLMRSDKRVGAKITQSLMYPTTLHDQEGVLAPQQ